MKEADGYNKIKSELKNRHIKYRIGNVHHDPDDDRNCAALSKRCQRCVLTCISNHLCSSSFELIVVQTAAQSCSVQLHRVPQSPDYQTQ